MARLAELLGGVTLSALGLLLLAGSRESLADTLGATPKPTDSAPAPPPSAEPARVASYVLDARLDAATHIITGKGTLTWLNTAREPTRELWFHLYLNAFKNERTVFLRSPFGAGRSGEHGTDWGYIDVSRLSIRELGNKDLWPDAARVSPGDPEDQTDIRLPLPSEVLPGKTLTIDFEWTSRLPSIVERSGYSGNFHFVGQWFPKLARREADGRWAHFAFHPQAEFYADFGRYQVNLDVPRQMIVGATGRETKNEVDGDRRHLSFEADRVHDFAWTAWPDFREKRETIAGVDVRVLYPPGHEKNAGVELSAVRAALPRMNQLYGPYPHPTLTVVHPPEHAKNAGGMEYPTLITTGGPWWAPWSGLRMVEGVTVHELGHQWFQGMLASDEYTWPFLDEGLNTFAETGAMNAIFGSGSLVSSFGLEISGSAARRAVALESAHDDPVAQPAARFSSFQSIGALVYARTALILETLGNVWGREALERALGNYARRQRFGHPLPKNFLDELRAEMGSDAHDMAERALFDKGWVDYVLADLDCVPSTPSPGVFDGQTGRTTVEREKPKDAPLHSCRVLVRRRGTLEFPVHVDLIFASGKSERRYFDGHGDWATFEATGPDEVVGAIVDPERKVLLDQDFGNNARRKRPAFGHRVLERFTYFTELALGSVGP